MQTTVAAVTLNTEALNFSCIVRLYSDLFCNVSLTSKCTFSECRTNEGENAFKVTSLGALSSENFCPVSMSYRVPFITAKAFPGKPFFLGWCGFLPWHMCSLRNFLAFGLGAVQSQKAILVIHVLETRQEILAKSMQRHNSHFWRWFAEFLHVFLQPTLSFSILPSWILWTDA